MSPEWVVERVVAYLGAPFSSAERFFHATGGVVWAIVDVGSKTAWPFIISSVIIGWLVWLAARRRGWITPTLSFRQYAFPSDVYRHRSAVVDYKFVAVDLTIRALIFVPFIAGLSQLIYRSLSPLVGGQLALGLPFGNPLLRTLVVTIWAAAAADFVFFFAHYLMHRVPFLWRFHEVHHSAEVLTPVTVYRVHPVEELVNGVVEAVVATVPLLAITSYSGFQAEFWTIYGVNALTFAFLFCAFQLRHSHVWLSYGPVLSRIFISPAQHQIHHSVDSRHWDKNYGFMLAVWDALFRSLYVPRTRETIVFGVPGADPADFSTVWKIYWLPFVKAVRTLGRPELRQDLNR